MIRLIMVFCIFVCSASILYGEKKADYRQWTVDDLEKYICDSWWAEITNPNIVKTQGVMRFMKNYTWVYKGYIVDDRGFWSIEERDGQMVIVLDYKGEMPQWSGGNDKYSIFADVTNTMVWGNGSGTLQFFRRLHKR